VQRLAPSLVTLRARPPGCPAWRVAPGLVAPAGSVALGLGPGPPGLPGAGPVLQSAALVRTGLVVARTVKAAEENRSAEPAEESLSGTTVSY